MADVPQEEPAARDLGARISELGRWLSDLYALDLDLKGEGYVISCELARQLLPDGSPRTGLLVIEEADELQLGVYVDPEDFGDPGTLVEETSHLVCLSWHAARDLPVSALVLEIQAEIDRFLYDCHQRGRVSAASFACFESGSWADWVDRRSRGRYEAARRRAASYCRGLVRRFAQRQDTVGLASELRRYYRTSPAAKLRI